MLTLTLCVYGPLQSDILNESIFVCCIVNIHVIIVLVVSSCILVSRINKLKKWLFYSYLLTTITKALYQSSAARMLLHIMQFYQIESYHSSSSCGPFSMQFNGTLILLYFIEMLPHMVSSSLVWN